MSDERTRRIGHNEALYRQVNEQIQEVSKGAWAVKDEFRIICECGVLECMQQIPVDLAVYERTREDPNRFIVVPGHELEDVETIVEPHEGYVVIEKIPPEARRLAEDTSPRH
jgi:hypothetical protein